MLEPIYEIEIQNDRPFPVAETRLLDAAVHVLTAHQIVPESGMTIVITVDEDVAALNREFRGIDAPTDVLSFPADDLPDDLASIMDDEPPYLGDLVIGYPYAASQASREGHDLDDSLALLVVHGTLHLLGYDHDTVERRTAMWTAQEESLRALGIPVDIVPALEKD